MDVEPDFDDSFDHDADTLACIEDDHDANNSACIEDEDGDFAGDVLDDPPVEDATMDLDHLNPSQREVVLHGDEPLLVLAAAGTGKTETLTTRIAYMIKVRKIPQESILAVTFTNKAATEMRARASKLAGVRESELYIGTFHGICSRILRSHPSYKTFTIMDHADSVKMVKSCCDHEKNGLKPDEVFAQINAWRNEGLSPHEVGTGDDKKLGLILNVYRLYRQSCAKNNVVDFADLLMHVVQLFKTDHEFRDTYRSKWRHILVDEYQDTNPVQFDFVSQLFTKDHGLMVVGDDCQAIHEWRGARVKNILEFASRFVGTRTIKLEMNYRSVSTVLDAANNVIKNNVLRTDKKLVCTKDIGEAVHVHTFKSDVEEAAGVADLIKKGVDGGEFAYKDTAVLYRINAISHNFERVFREKGIPYHVVGTKSFFDRKEVKDVLSYMRLAANPDSDLDFKRIVNVPPRGVGPHALQKLTDYATQDKCSLFEAALRHHVNIRGDGLKNFMATFGINLYKPKKKAPVATTDPVVYDSERYRRPGDPLRVARQLLKDSNYMSGLVGDTDRIENVNEVLALVRKFRDSHGEPSTIQDFLSTLMLSDDLASDQEDNDNVVTLMSMHASKGLEFGTVFLVGVGEGTMPFRKAVEEGSLEEERRLMYVGITRAKRRLHITYPKFRWTHYGVQSQSLSRFVDEMKPAPIVRVSHNGAK